MINRCPRLPFLHTNSFTVMKVNTKVRKHIKVTKKPSKKYPETPAIFKKSQDRRVACIGRCLKDHSFQPLAMGRAPPTSSGFLWPHPGQCLQG